MLSILPIIAFVAAAAASKGDPPPGNWWSCDCYTSEIHWLVNDHGTLKKAYKNQGSRDFTYDWMLTATLCNGEYTPQAHYSNGRCVAFEPGYSINFNNWNAGCADLASKGFYQIDENGNLDTGRKYYGVGKGKCYLPGQ